MTVAIEADVQNASAETRSREEAASLAFATEMYRAVLMTFDADAVDRYFAQDYRQHGALAADGRDALKAFLREARESFPEVHSEIKRSFVDGDHVIFHVHVRLRPEDRGVAVVDMFRLEDGLIAEHWEVIQEVPETLMHTNGTF